VKKGKRTKLKNKTFSIELQNVEHTKDKKNVWRHFNKLYRKRWIEISFTSPKNGKFEHWHFDTFKINWNDIMRNIEKYN
jgi:hypothetical protein